VERIILEHLIFILGVNYSVNLTEFMGQVFVYAFNPYISMFGNLTWGLIFGFIGAAVYVSSERQTLTILGYLLLVGLIFVIILPWGAIAIFGLVTSFMVGSILYRVIVEN